MKTYVYVFIAIVPWFLLFCLVLGFVMGYRESLRDQKEREKDHGAGLAEVVNDTTAVRASQLSHVDPSRITQIAPGMYLIDGSYAGFTKSRVH